MACSAAPPTLEIEHGLMRRGHRRVAGVDEVGRGPLAGPVMAAAVILPQDWSLKGVNDSKKVAAKTRDRLAGLIREQAAAWALGVCEPAEIDRLNIHKASLLAMRRAVEGLKLRPDYLLVDGRFILDMDLPQQALVKGDGRSLSVAAASILAKVERDALMLSLHQSYPEYNFAANKGYPTPEHKQALRRFGPCPAHRESYGPVAQLSPGLDS